MPPRPAQRSPLVPDMKNLGMPPTSPFTQLLFDQDYALLLNELLFIRDELIGSAALIALVKEGASPTDLSKAMELSSDDDVMVAIWVRIGLYTRDTAYGTTSLIHRGLLPAVPAKRVVPFATALKTTPVKWEAFWSFVDQERAEGMLQGKAAWGDPQGALRTRVQRTLDTLNKKYSV